MNSSLLKDTWRTIERTRSRFLSLVAIVALGVSFFAGMNATAPDMLDTAKKYYVDTNAMDLQIVSTAGLTDSDLAVISSIQGIEYVSGEKFVDGVLKVNGEKTSEIDGSELIVRAISLDVEKAMNYSNGADDRTFLNRPQLIDGSWPSQPNQCVVDNSHLSTPEEFEIGAVVSIEGAGTDIEGSLLNKEYTITGIIRTPLYVDYERGNTTVGTGKLGTFMYVPKENLLNDYYSSLSIKLSGTDKLEPYSQEYASFVAPYVEYIESISGECIAPRIASLKSTYAAEVEKSDKEYADAKQRTDLAIAEAKQQVATVLEMAENGDATLAEYKRQYNEKALEANTKIDESKLLHSTQYAEWQRKHDEYNEARALVNKYANAEADYKTAQSEFNVANMQVNSLSTTVDYLQNLISTTRGAMNQLDLRQANDVLKIKDRIGESGLVGEEVDNLLSTINSLSAVGTAEEMAAYLEPELQNLEEQLASTRRQLSDTKTQLAAKKVELDNAAQLVERLKVVKSQLAGAEEQLASAEKELTDANYDIQFGELEVLSQLSDFKNQIADYETNLRIAKSKASTVEADFEVQRNEAYRKLENAKNRLDYAKNFLLNLDSAKWFVNDRNEALCGFEEYGNTADRTSALSMIFPWFFFIVSALVCLNTMTRMIEDERTQMGTFKALGFTNREIVFKYIVYSLSASVIGSLAGTLLGFVLFPSAITAAFGIMFAMPSLIMKYRFAYAIPGIFVSIACTVFAAYGASYRSLVAVPSTLMRPKAPKGGKRIFLEKYTKFWGSLGFMWKVTLRNVFRNKKRFIMAVIGVLGCTAMLVAGFGLQKSINTSLEVQFTNDDSIFRYDMQIVTNGSYDTTITDCEALSIVRARPEISMANMLYMKVFDTTSDASEKKMETYIMVPDDSTAFPNYIYVKDAKTGKLIDLPQTGGVITEKLADELSLSIGDTIIVNLDNGHQVGVPVAGIAENYAFHYVYMAKEVYSALFAANPTYNYISANLGYELDGEQKDTLAKELMSEYTISAMVYQDDICESFGTLFDALGYIVLVLIVSAGLLSLIVLYNLSSINIHERMKEIATIKVLGFNDKEVSDYIFRENFMLGAIGTVIGLVLGIGLHRVVTKVGEVDIIMFGESAGVMAYIYAAALSMVFTVLVNLILRHNLRKVNMVEALKSIE